MKNEERGSGKNYPFPRYTAKQVALRLGCTIRQATRILYTGHVPAPFELGAERLLSEAIDRNNRALADLRAQLQRRVKNHAFNKASDCLPSGMGRRAALGLAANAPGNGRIDWREEDGSSSLAPALYFFQAMGWL